MRLDASLLALLATLLSHICAAVHPLWDSSTTTAPTEPLMCILHLLMCFDKHKQAGAETGGWGGGCLFFWWVGLEGRKHGSCNCTLHVRTNTIRMQIRAERVCLHNHRGSALVICNALICCQSGPYCSYYDLPVNNHLHRSSTSPLCAVGLCCQQGQQTPP